MNDEEIKDFRLKMGKFLHNYYIKFGENKYNYFIKKISKSLYNQYGDAFTCDNLRIMEAEYVTLNARIHEKNKRNNS